MNVHLDEQDLRRLQELARREGKLVSDLVTEIIQEGLVVRGQNGDWLDEVAGSFENGAEFDEVVRLGEELRDAD